MDHACTGAAPKTVEPGSTQDGSGRSRTVENGLSTPTRGGLWAIARLLLFLATGGFAWFATMQWDRLNGIRRFQRTDDAYATGDLTPLAAKVSGHVVAVRIDDFSKVAAGDVLAEIDPSDYRAKLAQAAANRAAADAALAELSTRRAVQRALIRQAEASVAAAEADVNRSRLEAERQRALLRTHIAGTPQAVERAEADEKRSEAQLALNRAVLDQQGATLDGLDIQERQLAAQRAATDAQADLARNDLRDTKIRSPVDGMVGQRQVRVGQFVSVGTQVASVMALPNVWVVANFRETQMTNVRIGQRARITVDAFPDLALEGRVESWAPGTGSTFALLAPDNATGNFTKVVQRLPVKIVLDAAPALGTLVRPGMSVVAEVDTGGRPDAPDAPAADARASRP